MHIHVRNVMNCNAQVRNEFSTAMSQRGSKRGDVIVPYYLGLDCTIPRFTNFFITFVPPGSKSGEVQVAWLKF